MLQRQAELRGGRPLLVHGRLCASRKPYSLPFIQVADLVAHAAFQSILQNPARAFMHDWYRDPFQVSAAARGRDIEISRSPPNDCRLRAAGASLQPRRRRYSYANHPSELTPMVSIGFSAPEPSPSLTSRYQRNGQRLNHAAWTDSHLLHKSGVDDPHGALPHEVNRRPRRRSRVRVPSLPLRKPCSRGAFSFLGHCIRSSLLGLETSLETTRFPSRANSDSARDSPSVHRIPATRLSCRGWSH